MTDQELISKTGLSAERRQEDQSRRGVGFQKADSLKDKRLKQLNSIA